MKPILYDSFDYKYEFCRRCQIKIINTKFYNKEKDMNIITRFTWFDYDDLWEEEMEGELYKCDSLCNSIPSMKSWEYDWWYHDIKNKCFRYWNYNIKDKKTLIFLQNALWNCLQRKILKKDFEIYMLLIKKIPTELMYLISDYVGTDDNWCYYLQNKRKLI